MPQHRLLMLRRFFQDYKQLEGKAVKWTKFVRQRRPIQPLRKRCAATARSGARGSRARAKETYQTWQAFSFTMGCPALQPRLSGTPACFAPRR